MGGIAVLMGMAVGVSRQHGFLAHGALCQETAAGIIQSEQSKQNRSRLYMHGIGGYLLPRFQIQ